MTELKADALLRSAYARGFKEGMDAAAKDIDAHLSQQQGDGLTGRERLAAKVGVGIANRADLPDPKITPQDRDGLVEARQQGQREGKAAVLTWLRNLGAQKPKHSLWYAAEQLADHFEGTETPATALGGHRD